MAYAAEVANAPRILPHIELQESVASRIESISAYADHLLRRLTPLLKTLGGEDGIEIEIEVALREALANAVIHGNHQDPEKRVHITCRCSLDGDLSFTISDEGRGFDQDAVADPTAPDNLLLGHGRGILLMRALMDDVRFERNGTVVHLRKRIGSRRAA